jgi:hypothetical protein
VLPRVPPVKDAIVHGDTGEKIFAPFRLSAFVPMNIVICAAMLMPNPSVRTPATHHCVNPGALASQYSPGVRGCLAWVGCGGQMASQLFWQWFNQSYNVGVNHANRNASNQMSNSQIMLAYGGATPSLSLSCHSPPPLLPSSPHCAPTNSTR